MKRSTAEIILFLLLCLLLFLVLVLARPSFCYSQENQNLNSNITQLQTIYSRLYSLNQELKTDLSNSQNSLQKLKVELNSLKLELQTVSESLTESEMTSMQLREELKKAQNFLSSSMSAFQIYSKTAEQEIRTLELQRNLSIGAGIIGIILSIIFLWFNQTKNTQNYTPQNTILLTCTPSENYSNYQIWYYSDFDNLKPLTLTVLLLNCFHLVKFILNKIT